MPFQNLKQVFACINNQKRGSTWDCHKWAHETDWSTIVKNGGDRTPDEWMCALSGRRVAQLREEAEHLGLDPSGTKKDLCHKLSKVYVFVHNKAKAPKKKKSVKKTKRATARNSKSKAKSRLRSKSRSKPRY